MSYIKQKHLTREMVTRPALIADILVKCQDFVKELIDISIQEDECYEHIIKVNSLIKKKM